MYQPKMCRVADSFTIKNRGLVVVFDHSENEEMIPKPEQAVTLISPNNLFITTTIVGVEQYGRAIYFPNDPFGILVRGFVETINMMGWTCIFHI